MKDIFDLEEELYAYFSEKLDEALSDRSTAEVIYLLETIDNLVADKFDEYTDARELY